MGLKTGILFMAFVAGCFAIPTPNADEDLSIFFDHTDPSSRIVGGSVAAPGSATHMVALTSGLHTRTFSCGGAIITPSTVITAAHCIVPHYQVFLGTLSSSLRGTVGTNQWNLGGYTFAFSRNVSHPHYVHSIIKNDISLLITTKEIPMTDLIQPVPLSFDHTPADVEVRVTGWGRIREGGTISAQLLELYLKTIDEEQCVRNVKQASENFHTIYIPVDPELELCVFKSRGYGLCNGDSGSALVRTDEGTQVGIVSWGFPCAVGVPDMFVRVSAYKDFIQENMV